MEKNRLAFVRDGILGLAVGDAVGVPAEFKWRNTFKHNPVTDMTEYGTHFQPKGSWSDDSSMTFCTMDSLCGGYDLDDMMKKFCDWMFRAEYTPWGTVFDSGISTRIALNKYMDGRPVLECGGRDERSNGNGSLMRILPMVFFQREKYGDFLHSARKELIVPIHEVSAMTHAHPISMVGCGIYAQLIDALIRCREENADMEMVRAKWAEDLEIIWNDYGWHNCGNLYEDPDFTDALEEYERLLTLEKFVNLPEDEIMSTGYVVYTLEAAIWCFLNTDNYRDCVLKAVNLGNDTDTVAAVAGSFAGIFYGTQGIPKDWINSLARLEWIEDLLERFESALKSRNVF